MAPVLCSCQKDPAGGGEKGGADRAVFSLQVPPLGTVNTKAVDETAVSDVWVLQFAGSGDGAAQVGTPQYLSGSTFDPGNLSVTFSSGEVVTFYFIANTGDASLFAAGNPATVGDLKAMNREVADEAGVTPGGRMLMCGTWTGVMPEAVGKIPVVLQRSAARVDFVFSSTLPGYTLKSVRLRRVANKLAYVPPKPDSLCPAAQEGNHMDYAVIASGFPSVFTWYVPVNQRGVSKALDNEIKKTEENAPEGQGPYCTYVEVEGDCVENGLTERIVLKVFLGWDALGDFNLSANNRYLVSVALAGRNEYDLRIRVYNPLSGWVSDPNGSGTEADYPAALPVVLTEDAYNIQPFQASLRLIVLSPGGTPMTRAGWKVSTKAGFDPATEGREYFGTPSGNIGHYSLTLTSGLTASTTYYYRAFAVNAAGRAYGEEKSFTTRGMDYTDNDRGRYLSGGTDTSDPSAWNDWMTGAGPGTDGSLCPAGWRMPSLKETMGWWVFKPVWPAATFSEVRYWTMTASSNNGSKWVVHMASGSVESSPMTAKQNVRCVQDNPSTRGKYPYVLEGRVIVSRDASGGVAAGAIHEDWAVTPAHTEAGAENRVAAAFEVYRTESTAQIAWGDASTLCAPGWRVPTQRELMLVWMMVDELTGVAPLEATSYWSATEHSANSGYGWRFFGGNGYTSTISKTVVNRVRCVRDVARGKTYPYVLSGTNVIVARDVYGAFTEFPFHGPWTGETPHHVHESPLDAIPAMLEADTVDRLDGESPTMPLAKAIALCSAAGWRLPTNREAALISRMKANMISVPTVNAYYWTASEKGTDNTINRVFNYSAGGGGDGYKISYPGRVRCVRDVD